MIIGQQLLQRSGFQRFLAGLAIIVGMLNARPRVRPSSEERTAAGLAPGS
jgi:hypothetical protein